MKRNASAVQRYVERMSGLSARAPMQRVETRSSPNEALLIDAEGELHGLSASTIIGRDVSLVDFAVLHDSVSRRHVELRRDYDTARWWVRDLESTNGTFLDGIRVEGVQEIRNQQLLVLGHIGFVFLLDDPVQRPLVQPTVRCSPGTVVRLVALPGGDGLVEYKGRKIRLGAVEFAFVYQLGRRLIDEREAPDATRGFVRSIELGALIEATCAGPIAPIRQISGWVQRRLRMFGGKDLVEAHDRLGYRLRVDPLIVKPPP